MAMVSARRVGYQGEQSGGNMKRLLFSDIHFHPWNYGASVDEHGRNTRLMMQYEAAREMVLDAVEQGVKYAYFCGDLFHEHGNISTQALNAAAGMFRMLRSHGIKIRTIPGNHDMASRDGWVHGLTWLPEEERMSVWEDEGLRVLCQPYTTDEDTLKQFLENAHNKEAKMIMLHQGVAGVPLASGYVLDEKLTPEMIPDGIRAFTGHYHFHRAVSPNLTVVGNLTPLNWSDIDQPKGWVIWDDATGSLEHRIQTKSPGFMSYHPDMDMDLVQGQFVRYIEPVKPAAIEAIRHGLLKEGALTVEFPSVQIDVKQDKIRTSHDVLVEHVKKAEAADMDPRRREVGVEIREERYDAGR
jgi:DNA repair exonuclease SbcCD nuclease subunit